MTVQLCAVIHHRAIVELVLDGLLVEVGIADEEMRAARHLDQGVRPLGVAGISDYLLSTFNAQGVRRCAARVDHLVWRDSKGADRSHRVGGELDKPAIKSLLRLGGTGE